MRMSSRPLVQPQYVELVTVGMKRERNKSVEARRTLLRFAQANEVIDALFERFDVP